MNELMMWRVFGSDGGVLGLGSFMVLQITVCWVLYVVLCRGVCLGVDGMCSMYFHIQVFAFVLVWFLCLSVWALRFCDLNDLWSCRRVIYGWGVFDYI